MSRRRGFSSRQLAFAFGLVALGALGGVLSCDQPPPPPPPTPTPTQVHCGGIAGIACPGSGVCQDDPTDSCDPKHGGADCGGVCSCGPNTKLCIKGDVWNGDPSVCACVPAGPTCGPNTCAPGQYCCNASCGICAPKGAACIQIACDPPK
jgi:hypothetical protein